MSNIVDLAEARQARTPVATKALVYQTEDEALGALASALDTVAAASQTLDALYQSPTVADWAALVAEGTANRIARLRRGAQ